MPRAKQKKSATPTPGRRLRNTYAAGPPIPPEPDPPDIPSPLESNPFSALDQSDTDDDNTNRVSSKDSGLITSIPPPSNHDLSSKLDALISMINTTNSNFAVIKNEVELLKARPPITAPLPSPILSVDNLIGIPQIVPQLPVSTSPPDTTPPTNGVNPTCPPTSPKVEPSRSPSNVPAVQNDTSLDTSLNNKFGQNEFSVAVSGNSKMKFSTMETTLKDCVLLSDSQRDMKSLYENITKAITFVVNQELELLPSFQDLHRKIDFESLFLSNLHGATLSKCKPIFLRFGTIIRSRLLMKDCIDPSKCPKASLKILTHSLMDGWKLLETILKSRLVIC